MRVRVSFFSVYFWLSMRIEEWRERGERVDGYICFLVGRGYVGGWEGKGALVSVLRERERKRERG
jgi:hypothetical protein